MNTYTKRALVAMGAALSERMERQFSREHWSLPNVEFEVWEKEVLYYKNQRGDKNLTLESIHRIWLELTKSFFGVMINKQTTENNRKNAETLMAALAIEHPIVLKLLAERQ